jgi:DNA-binding NarL/FixJ family response regulator
MFLDNPGHDTNSRPLIHSQPKPVTARKATKATRKKAAGTRDLGALIGNDTLSKLKQLSAARGLTIDQLIRQLLASSGNPPRKAPDLSALTPRQMLVLSHLKSGLSVKETANKMGISEETVRTHILRARNRLDCSDLLSLRFQ